MSAEAKPISDLIQELIHLLQERHLPEIERLMHYCELYCEEFRFQGYPASAVNALRPAIIKLGEEQRVSLTAIDALKRELLLASRATCPEIGPRELLQHRLALAEKRLLTYQRCTQNVYDGLASLRQDYRDGAKLRPNYPQAQRKSVLEVYWSFQKLKTMGTWLPMSLRLVGIDGAEGRMLVMNCSALVKPTLAGFMSSITVHYPALAELYFTEGLGYIPLDSELNFQLFLERYQEHVTISIFKDFYLRAPQFNNESKAKSLLVVYVEKAFPGDTCLCLDIAPQFLNVPCGHAVCCDKCLDGVLNAGLGNTCSVCRQDVFLRSRINNTL